MMDEASYRSDLIQCRLQSKIRGLNQSAKWASELLFSLPRSSTPVTASDICLNHDAICEPDYAMGKDCFDCAEYDRCAYFCRNSTSREGRFLHYYARYMAAEKKSLDMMVDTNPFTSSAPHDNITSLYTEIRSELNNSLINGQLTDGYLLYVYGITLLKLDLIEDAISALAHSVHFEPLNWASWQQLAVIIADRTQLEQLDLPTHWFKKIFLGAVYLELQLNEEAMALYTSLLDTFKDSNYLKSQMANVKHNLRHVDQAIDLFDTIRESDPFRLDAWDIYSNLLYVKDMRSKLSSLAHAAKNIDPFRVESCFCIANFYSLRGQHKKAADYFSRVLQLNPRHISAWTLMGHEYMEIKNTGGAIMSYRSAIECNKKDYRAWYGLGQTYEILKMPAYSLYYYSIARSLRPDDSRMIIAMGETLEKLERHSEAIKCYWKAGGIALVKLAALYEKLGEKDKAAAAYSDFVAQTGNMSNLEGNPDLPNAYKFLANYYLSKKDFKMAHNAAQQCQQYAETRDEGKRILKEIAGLVKTGANPASSSFAFKQISIDNESIQLQF
ncbi:cell division cycle protein 23 homolog [Tetranychus urticae]|uniref:cell division cycle protein 23 homolog n=1 Tax=Tetranychus urticae TaxID=32264 RepID=UPI00077BD1AD|nr:cell division cycle protein 23 homolog [Tetranychus urticae]